MVLTMKKVIPVNYCTYSENDMMLDYCVPDLWTSCPWINYEKVDRKFTHKMFSNIVDFFVEMINNDRAAYFLIDRYYLSLCQQKDIRKHMFHSIFLYGYDLEKRIFNVADNFPISEGKYSFQTCPFDELATAFNAVSYPEKIDWTSSISIGSKTDWIQGVNLISHRTLFDHNMHHFSDYYHWNFDIELFKTLLEDFILSKNSAKKFPNPKFAYLDGGHCFGLDCYDFILNKISNFNYIDHRAFYLLMEYQYVMSKRIEYLLDKKFIQDFKFILLSQEIEANMRNILSLVLKYNIGEKKDEIM